jgi:UDP-glucose:(heptosyl)LPS alpha-1,3-glucosyltransferase
MRFAVIRQEYTVDAPAERFVESALEALLERNVAVSLYTRTPTPPRLQLIEHTVCDPFHFGKWWRDAGFAAAVCRRIARSKPNLVEAHLPVRCCDIYRAENGLYATWFEEELAAASRWRALRLQASPRWRYLLATEAAMLRSPWLSAVICPSPLVKDELRDRFGLPETQLPVIRQPVDVDVFKPELRAHRSEILARHGIDADATVFLFASNDWQRDGARAVIEAMGCVAREVHLLLLGNASAGGRYAQWVRHHGQGARVTFAGLPADPERYLGAADAFVHPARYDPRASATLNAMAVGLPVVVSEHSGAAQLVQESGCGLVLPARDATTLAAAMDSLADAGLREQLGGRARAAALPFAPAAMTLKQVVLYRDLLAGTARANDARRSGAGRGSRSLSGPHAPAP